MSRIVPHILLLLPAAMRANARSETIKTAIIILPRMVTSFCAFNFLKQKYIYNEHLPAFSNQCATMLNTISSEHVTTHAMMHAAITVVNRNKKLKRYCKG